MPTTPLPPPILEFLRLPNPAVMATVAADGRPVTVATWYLLEDDGRVLLGLDAKRARLKHLHADPRVSLTVLAQDDWYTHVSLQGRVLAITEGCRAARHRPPLAALQRQRVPQSRPAPGERPGRDRELARLGQAPGTVTSARRGRPGACLPNLVRVR